jgi:CRISPR/Cas system CMR-associated protein Cmr5 small subunit
MFFLIVNITGGLGRTYYGSISFKETIDKIPQILIFSFALLITLNFIQSKSKKLEKNDIEAARKRIAEREKEGVNSNTLVDEIVKDVMKNSKQAESKDEKE